MPRFCCVVVLSILVLFVSGSIAQTRIQLHTCEDLKITKTGVGAAVIETAACVGPAKTFSPKGTLRNVHLLATFPAVPTGAGITFLITKDDANGEDVRYVDYTATPRHTTAY